MANQSQPFNLSIWWAELTANTQGLVLVTLEFSVLLVAIYFLNKLWKSKEVKNPKSTSFRLLTLSLIAMIGFLIIYFLQPGQKASIDLLVKLLGILLSAAIALSSTTFISNFMAGIMLSRVSHFRAGDWLSVGDHLGRVSEMGLLHTEIQTEDSNLTTFPNLYLITTPCKVARKGKTVVSATVSLGYDIPRTKVKEILCLAAEKVPLKDPLVRILELGDFAVTYRVAGILENSRQLLLTRSKLREKMLDSLHEARVEIVSPSFMYTRPQSANEQVISDVDGIDQETPQEEQVAEAAIWDKADKAESIENIRLRREALHEQIAAIKAQLKEAETDAKTKQLEGEIRWRESSIEFLEKQIETAEGSS